MEKGTETAKAGTGRGRGAKGARLAVHEERVVAAADVPAGSRLKGYEDFLVQDLVLRPHVIRLMLHRLAHPNRKRLPAP